MKRDYMSSMLYFTGPLSVKRLLRLPGLVWERPFSPLKLPKKSGATPCQIKAPLITSPAAYWPTNGKSNQVTMTFFAVCTVSKDDINKI